MLRFFDTFDALLGAVRDAVLERPRLLVLRGTLAPAARRDMVELARSLGATVTLDPRDLTEVEMAGPEAPTTRGPDAPAADELVVVIETAGPALGSILMDYVERPDAELLCLKTAWHYSQRPLLFSSVPKSGTHLALALLQAFGYEIFRDPRKELNLRRGVANELLRDRQLGEHVVRLFSPDSPALPGGVVYPMAEPSFHMPFSRLFEVLSGMGIRRTRILELPIVFSYRNPLGVMISEAWAYRDSKRHILGHYFSTFEDTESICHDLVRGIALISLVERLGEYPGWLRLANVLPVSFEELVGAEGGGDAAIQRQLIWSLQLKLQIPGDPRDYAAGIYDRRSPTFRRGRLDAFADELPDHRAFLDGHPELRRRCEDFGYDPDRASAHWPQRHATLRRRPLGFDSPPAPVARLGASLVWSTGRHSAALPAVFATLCRHCALLPETAVALGELRELAADFGSLRARVRSAEVQARHRRFRSLGDFWLFAVVSDGRRYYAFRRDGETAIPCQSTILAADDPAALLAAICDAIHGLCRRAPQVVFAADDTNLVLYGDSAYLIPRRIGHVEIGPDEQPDHPEAVRFSLETFLRYFFEREAGDHLRRWAAALELPEAPAEAARPEHAEPDGQQPVDLAGAPADILAYLGEAAA
ncbi:hypothetical protein SAMN06265365_12830 [Tistlia consotensis]|uniref:Uncharacterized protein n=1 Tax=Tistlia consotensis USBA 355 TaxID=560819 RepID=A0A1Y6CKI3_9PROT|nr:hypothetical protein [Tistlia consotensis]SMF71743.1 hypothetical protein SAMN05428998_13052 [Tistlia consotensis USBA 355]SNS06405.1 hypothetical protein SAMN06265365_12830 [Tistlia consotensis]